MKRILIAVAGLTALTLSAEAQSYRCEHGELVGGEADVTAKCTVNSSGQITSVTPYQATPRSSVKIYPNSQVRSAPVKTYTPSKRVYAPTALTPQTARSSAHSYQTQTVHSTSSNDNRFFTQGTTTYNASQPRIIAAAPTPRIQRTAYASPCNFKVREVKTQGNINIYEVCYSDIQTTNRRSLNRLYSRIKKASRRACGTDYDSVLTRWNRNNSRCVTASVNRAVMSSGLDPLRAYHLAKTGKGVPTVYVGEPRDAY